MSASNLFKASVIFIVFIAVMVFSACMAYFNVWLYGWMLHWMGWI